MDGAAYGATRALINRRTRPKNNRVAVIGDSIASHNSVTTAPNRRTMAHGYLTWASYLSRQRFWFSVDSNAGIPGDNTNDVLARIDAFLLGNDAGVIVLDCLTNDGPNSVTLAQSQTNYSLLVRKIQDAGRIVVCIAPRPRDITASGLTMTASQARQHIARKEFVVGLHSPGDGIYVVNTWSDLGDPTSANMATLAGMTYDGLHPGQVGAYWDGYRLAMLFGMGREDGLFPFVDVLCSSALDVYNASDHLRGCLNSNPMLTAGSPTATGYAAINGQGLTTTLSKVVVGNKTWQQCAVAGTATGTGIIWPLAQNPLTAGNLTIGDVVEGFCDFEQDAGLTGLAGCGLALMDNTSFGRAMFCDSTSEINGMALPAVAHAGVMRLPRFTLTSTGVRAGIAASAVNGAVVSSTFRVGAMSFRKV